MGSKGSSRHMKRNAAPAFWRIPRKEGRFVVKPSPGPHPISRSYPLSTLLRDVLKNVKTMREARSLIVSGKILVDGVVRREPKFAVGLMDAIQFPSMGTAYRLLPSSKVMLYPIKVDIESISTKLCKVKSKHKIRSGFFSYGLHDGRTIVSKEDLGLSSHDSVILKVPKQEIVSKAKFEKGSLALLLKGKSAGKIGLIKDIVNGSFSSEKSANVEVDGSIINVPARLLIVVGVDKPLIAMDGVS